MGLIGQLLAQSQGAEGQYSSPFGRSGRQAEFVWHFGSGGQQFGNLEQHEDSPEAEPASTNAIDIDELQNSLQFVLVRINSLERRPLYWSAQVEELQSAYAQLSRCRQGTIANPQQTAERIQAYVDTVNAQLDEFLTQAEARQQQERQRRGASSASQPSAPPFTSAQPPHAPNSTPYASSPPQPDANTASSQAPTAATGGGWQWKWGWGSAPTGSTPDDSSPNSQTDSAQQAVGTGLTNAASAAASAASAIYHRFSAAVRAGTAPTRSESADQETQHAQHGDQPAPSGRSIARQSDYRQQAHASAGPSNARQAPRNDTPDQTAATGPDGLPIGQAYEAIRNIFDQHVDPQSRLGQWGSVASHLSNLHAEMNPADRQQQDAGRMLAAAVNAYSAYRRASAASQQS